MSQLAEASTGGRLDLNPSELVDVVLAWLEPRLPERALDRAIVHNLAPFLIWWAAGTQAKTDQASPGTRAALRRMRRDLKDYTPHLGDMPADVASPGHHVGKADLLAICLQPNATRAFVPVATRLQAAGAKVLFLLEHGDLRSQALLQPAGLSFRTTPPLGRLEIWPTFATSCLRVSRLWRDRRGLRDLVTALGLPATLVARLAKDLRRAILRATLRAAAIDSALRALPSDNVLFVTHRALLNHLLYDTHPGARRFFFLQGIVPDIPPMRTKLDVDHAIIGSTVDLPYVLRCGIEQSQISITGYPDYDHYALLDKQTCRQEVDARVPGARGRRLVVFTSQYRTAGFSDEARLKNFEEFLETARKLPDALFIAKLHPRMESVPLLELPPNVVLEQHTDTPRLIKAADALVTFWSTTALEAVLLGTPLVQLNATGLPDFLDLSTPYGRPIARSAHELAELLRPLLTPTSDAAAGDFLHADALSVAMDGHAAARASEALLTRLRRAT